VYYTLILKFYITHFLCITLDSVQPFYYQILPIYTQQGMILYYDHFIIWCTWYNNSLVIYL